LLCSRSGIWSRSPSSQLRGRIMAVVVYFESMLRNQHKICNRRGAPVSSTTSKHSCARTVRENCHRLVIHFHSRISVGESQQRAGRVFRVRCSSTADASRDSCMPLPTLYELLEIPQHVGECATSWPPLIFNRYCLYLLFFFFVWHRVSDGSHERYCCV